MKTDIQIPTVPAYVKVMVGSTEVRVHVSEIPTGELEHLGTRWTRMLLAKAKQPKPE